MLAPNPINIPPHRCCFPASATRTLLSTVCRSLSITTSYCHAKHWGDRSCWIYRHTLLLSLVYPRSLSSHIMRCLIRPTVAGAMTPGSARNGLQKQLLARMLMSPCHQFAARGCTLIPIIQWGIRPESRLWGLTSSTS